jgi:uncharacterized protein with von Willebrand factor type A (vWA) domain
VISTLGIDSGRMTGKPEVFLEVEKLPSQIHSPVYEKGSGIEQIPPMDYSLNRIRRISCCRLLFGRFNLSAHERIQIEENADREEDAAEAHKEHEGNWAMTQEAKTLNEQTENQDDSGRSASMTKRFRRSCGTATSD